MAIIGEDLSTTLINQIKVRQEKLGKTLLDPEDIMFANSNTSWIRAASSVDIINNDVKAANLQDLGIGGSEGNHMANNCVLFGGVSNTKGTLPSEALSTSPHLEQQVLGYYGWGGHSDKWGYTPPPALQSLTIKALNRGAIRKAELNILVHNPDQFRIIDALYMRLGFSILVEWGHTVYFDNEKNLVNNIDYNTKAFDTFMGQSSPSSNENDLSTFNKINSNIEEEKVLRNFNYGGFIGYVSNFNWSFNADNTYNINLSVITRGGLIDSLTLNHPSSQPQSSKKGHSHTLSVLLDNWKQAANSGQLTLESSNYENITYNASSEYAEYNNQQGEPFKDLFSQDAEIVNIKFNQKQETYCTLGLLLKTIEKKCLFYDKNSSPIISIDNEYGNSFMLTHPFQSSLDPGVCIIPSEVPQIGVYKETVTNGETVNKLEFIDKTSILGGIDGNVFRTDNPFKGDIMGILVNLDYIGDTFNSSIRGEGTVSLNSFLESLLEGINTAMGSINNFHLSYDESINLYQIYDDNTIPNTKTQFRAQGKINIFTGKNTEEGSFVKNINITSKIFPKIQNLVAIAAQNPEEGTIGEKVGSYQRLNKGLIDRTSDGGFKSFEEKDLKEEDSVPFSKYKQIIYNISSHLVDTYNNFKYPERTNIQDLQVSYPKLLTGDLQWRSKKGEIVPPFFIPVEITLTMHGLTGFKLFQKFDIAPDYIFPSYMPNNLNYIIQGITHDLKGGEWTTTLNTLSWMAENPLSVEEVKPLELPIVGYKPTPRPKKKPENNPNAKTPNADRLRVVLKELGYSEKGRELSNGGDITTEMANYAISVFKTIKNINEGLSIKVTGGNDEFHHTLPYVSRHTLGRGVDFVISPSSEASIKQIEEILRGFAGGNYEQARYLNEYDDPTKAATDKHFHISWGEGSEAQSSVDDAYAKVQEGKITPYKIT